MDKKSFIKMNKERRRIKTAKEVVEAIKTGKLYSYNLYATGLGDKCYTCAIGASIAFTCDFNPSCVLSVRSSSEIGGQDLSIDKMAICGFSRDFTLFIEAMFEPGKVFRFDSNETKKNGMRNKLHKDYPKRDDRLLKIWQTIYENKGVYPGYEGVL